MITTNSTNVTHIDTRRLSEAELDARIAELDANINANALDRAEQLSHRKALSRQSVIPLDSSLLASLLRALRRLFRT